MNWRWGLLFVAAWLFYAVQPAAAEEDMEINVNLPLGGIVKYESWIRMDITISSPKHSFSGYVGLTKNRAARTSTKLFGGNRSRLRKERPRKSHSPCRQS